MQHLVKAVIFVFLATVVPSFGADVAKIGIVDFQKILKESSAGKKAQAEITEKGNKMKEDFDKKGEEIEELKKKLEREALVMSKDMREEKEREIRIKINDLKTLQRKYTQEFKAFEGRRVKQIQKEVFELVEKMGKKEGYLLIMERVGVLYYPNTVDITDKVIAEYNKVFAKGSGEKKKEN